MNDHSHLRQQLLQLLNGRNAHMTLEDATANFPPELINSHPPNVPYTFWHLLEHMRIAQWDILDFIRNPEYVHLDWPEGYWPNPSSTATYKEWNETLAQFRSDRELLAELIIKEDTDLFADLAPQSATGGTTQRGATDTAYCGTGRSSSGTTHHGPRFSVALGGNGRSRRAAQGAADDLACTSANAFPDGRSGSATDCAADRRFGGTVGRYYVGQ